MNITEPQKKYLNKWIKYVSSQILVHRTRRYYIHTDTTNDLIFTTDN